MRHPSTRALEACVHVAARGLRPIADRSRQRFLGKVRRTPPRCRGGERAVDGAKSPLDRLAELLGDGRREQPAARDRLPGHLGPNGRGIDGALLDLEYQRIELIKFNLFDNSGTYARLREGPRRRRRARAEGVDADAAAQGPSALRRGGRRQTQVCGGELIRFRTLTGICNDLKNPLMGSSRMPFARNVQFEVTFPELGQDAAHAQPARRPPGPAQARSAGDQPPALHPRAGQTRARAATATACPARRRRALRLQEGAVLQRARRVLDPVHDPRLVLAPAGGPQRARADGGRLPAATAARLGCRPDDRIDRAYVAESGDAAARSPPAARTAPEPRAYKTSPRTTSPRGGTPRRSTATTRPRAGA